MNTKSGLSLHLKANSPETSQIFIIMELLVSIIIDSRVSLQETQLHASSWHRITLFIKIKAGLQHTLCGLQGRGSVPASLRTLDPRTRQKYMWTRGQNNFQWAACLPKWFLKDVHRLLRCPVGYLWSPLPSEPTSSSGTVGFSPPQRFLLSTPEKVPMASSGII